MEKVSRITKYSDEEINSLRERFVRRFNEDVRPFKEKLNSIQIPKGTYSNLLSREKTPKKHTLESIRAYLENRPPKFTLVKKGESYCSACELIHPTGEMKDKWTCKECALEINLKTRANNKDKYIQMKRNWYARTVGMRRIKKYGTLADCVDLISRIKEELKNV